MPEQDEPNQLDFKEIEVVPALTFNGVQIIPQDAGTIPDATGDSRDAGDND